MIFKKACSRIESKPRLFQDRRGRRSLQKKIRKIHFTAVQ